MEKLLSPPQAARLLSKIEKRQPGYTREYLSKLCREKKLTAQLVNNSDYIITLPDLIAFAENRFKNHIDKCIKEFQVLDNKK